VAAFYGRRSTPRKALLYGTTPVDEAVTASRV